MRWIICLMILSGIVPKASSQGQIRANAGQWSNQIVGNIPLSFGDIWIEKDGLVFVFYDNLGHETISALEGHQFSMRLLNSNTPDAVSYTHLTLPTIRSV